MCGISAILPYGAFKDIYVDQVKKMNSLIRHRGPDDSGIYVGERFVFGHTRLSIIDTTQAGHQPMLYQDRYVITYNGEVYNYIEIRDELTSLGYEFSSDSDTEVLLAAYACWKEDMLFRLNGMFAFAIYDLAQQVCFIARDRTGVKPLYFAEADDAIFLFSEPKQVVCSDIIKAIPNNQAIREYLAFQFTLSENTFFQGIKKVLPGHYIVYKEGNLDIKQYWSLNDIEVDQSIGYEAAKQEVKRLVDEAVQLRLRADVPLGAYLSGGIDSSVIATIASRHVNNLATYTFTSKGSPKVDESEVASMTAQHIQSLHHEVELEVKSIKDKWIESVYYMDEPEVGFSLIPQMEISSEIGQDLKVVLGGLGGDELFYGYGWHTDLYLSIVQQKLSIVRKLKMIKVAFVKGGVRKALKRMTYFFQNRAFGKEKYFDFWSSTGVYDYLLSTDDLKQSFFDKLGFDGNLIAIKRFEYTFWLQALLHVEDRSSMQASLESRVPLLDYRIAEYAFKLKPEFMIDGLLNKKVFIDAYRSDLLECVTKNKQKKGYSSPIDKWFKDKEVKRFIKEILDNQDSFIYQFVHFQDRQKFNHRQVWMLICCELWYRIFVDKTIGLDKGVKSEV